ERHRHRHREVVTGASEHRVRGDVHQHVEVPGRRAAHSRLALPGQPDLLAVGHSGRDPHGQRAVPGGHPAAAALSARVVDDPPGAAAIPARLGQCERPLTASHQPGATAGRAGSRDGTGASTGAATAAAARRAGDPQRHSGPANRLGEVDPDLCLDVGAAARAAGTSTSHPTTATAAQTTEQITQTAGIPGPGAPRPEQVAEVEPTGAAEAATPGPKTAVEQAARLVILL